jgi:hypothetical protein
MEYLSVGTLIALFVGLWAGAVFARAGRARRDHRNTKKLVAGMRKTFWSLVFQSVRAGLVIGFFAVAFVLGMRAASG